MNTPSEASAELARRLLEVADIAEMTEDGDRIPGNDPTAACVFVDMRPGDFDSLLRNAASLLSSHGGGGEAVAWMRRNVKYREGDGRTDGERVVSERKVYDDDLPLYLSPQPRAEGMVLVPMEPTETMYARSRHSREATLKFWRSMLAAAPGEGGGELDLSGLGDALARMHTVIKNDNTPPPASQSALIQKHNAPHAAENAPSPTVRLTVSQSATPPDDNRATKGCTYNCDCVGRCKRGLD